MSSRNAALADAVKAAINAAPNGTFTPAIVAVRAWVPRTDLETLKKLIAPLVTVVPAADQSERTARDTEEHELKILIGVEMYVGADPATEAANAVIDPLAALVEQIDDFFTIDTVPQGSGNFVSSNIQTLADPASMMTEKVFRSVVAVTFLKGI